jgi:hypothetical protein
MIKINYKEKPYLPVTAGDPSSYSELIDFNRTAHIKNIKICIFI